jgi:four helix bundle protein
MADRFEELIAWQKARRLTAVIYEVTQRGNFRADRGLAIQMQRAAVSIMSNIAEGFERGSPGEFRQFLNVAKASCAEVRSQLYVALDVKHLQQREFDQIFAQAQEVARLVNGLRASLDRHPAPQRGTPD